MTKSLEQIQGWQPIETAPKDGNCILLYVPRAQKHKLVSGQYHSYGKYDGRELGGWTDRWNKPINNPTHWTPLPKPPTE